MPETDTSAAIHHAQITKITGDRVTLIRGVLLTRTTPGIIAQSDDAKSGKTAQNNLSHLKHF